MTRIIAVVLIVTCAGCTGPTLSEGKVRDSSPRKIPEPSTPGVHVSGHVIVGVSTVK